MVVKVLQIIAVLAIIGLLVLLIVSPETFIEVIGGIIILVLLFLLLFSPEVFKKGGVLAVIVILFVYGTLSSVRFCIPNSRDPEMTVCKFDSYFGTYYIIDENVKCWSGNQCFWINKKIDELTREDVCEHCERKWKWHYNK